MTTAKQLANHINEVFFGGNWTSSNVKDNLSEVSWVEATTKVESFQTIATLLFHIAYFVNAAIKVLEVGELDANDKFSFSHGPIKNEDDWQSLMNQTLKSANKFAELVGDLPANKLNQIFVDEKYGTYHRNILGIIEHTHYHLGQIALIKNLIKARN